jgi:enoyl-CoA hydratase/carnithine racemase
MLNHTFQTLKLDKPQPYTLLVTLNRPEVMNAINSVMMRELHQLWTELYAPAEDIRCVVLTGSGDKAFCAGADLKERANIIMSTWQQQHAALQQAMLAMIDCPIPIIAAVNGVAFGGGLELTMAADFAYAVETARFAQSETKLGIMPGAMGTQNLPRSVGLRRAKELCFTAAPFSAQQAHAWGILNQLCKADSLLPMALVTAETIASNAPLAVRQAKRAMNMSENLDLKSGYSYEVAAYNQLLPTQDRQEGIAAFNEKRTPNFKGQ